MTTSSRDYNVVALKGGDITDMEYVEQFGIPKEYAHTKQINEWMLDKVQTDNERWYTSQGYTEDAAKSTARSKRMRAAEEIEILYKLNDM